LTEVHVLGVMQSYLCKVIVITALLETTGVTLHYCGGGF
jgi:hypothetical protein